jgi:hypothetical protein
MLPVGELSTMVLTPSLMSLYVAPLVDQLSITSPPEAIVEGDTLRDAVGIEPEGGVDGVERGTNTVVVAVLLP